MGSVVRNISLFYKIPQCHQLKLKPRFNGIFSSYTYTFNSKQGVLKNVRFQTPFLSNRTLFKTRWRHLNFHSQTAETFYSSSFFTTVVHATISYFNRETCITANLRSVSIFHLTPCPTSISPVFRVIRDRRLTFVSPG